MREEIEVEEQVDNLKQSFGLTYQKSRNRKHLTQEQVAENLAKSPNTISRIETAKDGTSKQTDVDFMNLLEIMPNQLYKEFITNPNLKKKLEISERICNLSPDKIEALCEIIDAIEKL